MSEFGDKLKKLRLDKKLSLRELGERSGLSYSFIGSLEKGRFNPSRESITSLSKALGVDPDELLLLAGFTPNEYDIQFIETDEIDPKLIKQNQIEEKRELKLKLLIPRDPRLKKLLLQKSKEELLADGYTEEQIKMMELHVEGQRQLLLTPNEHRLLHQIRNNPKAQAFFNDLADAPDSKIRKFLKMWSLINEDIENDDDEEPQD